MRKSIILVFLVLLVFALPAQEIERAKSNLPEISEVISVLDEATGWVLQDNGGWLSAKNKILNFNSEQNRSADPMHGLGHQNFEQLELHEVLIGDEQYIVLIIKSAGGYFEFPALRQDFHKTRDARYIVFHAKKLEEILATANTFNEPIAINLDVFCSDNIIDYDKKQLTTQIAYNILRVQKMEEPSKFTMIFAIMPVIINGEKSFRFRYLNLFNQESIYKNICCLPIRISILNKAILKSLFRDS